MDKFYDKYLALIHHTYYGDIARSAAELILGLNQSEGHGFRNALDIGCGSGILSSRLNDHDISVTGIDISANFIELAKRNAPGANFICTSIYDYQIESVDVVAAVGEPFNYFNIGKVGYKDLEKVILNVHQNLSDAGIFLFDILTDGVDPDKRVTIVEEEMMTMIIKIEIDQIAKELTREIICFIKEDDCYKREVETHKQFLFTSTIVEDMLKNAGFSYSRLSGYGDVKFRQGHIGFLCRKASR
jgi:2-polyprenyl-3-methyl-5-hydroxy-6-metoxy-1,4-benzoquinol methylase